MSIVIANAQTAGFGYKYLSNFSTRMALYCNDSNEYSALFDYCSERIDNIPGRAIIERDKKQYECQSYLAFQGEKEIDRVQEIKQYISETNSRNKNTIAKRIPLIPASLTKGFMVEQFGQYMKEQFSIVIGLDYATVTPCVLDFASAGLLAITGREGAGRHNWLKYSIDMIATEYPEMSKVYVVDHIGKKLSSKECDHTVAYTVVADDAILYMKEIEQKVKERYDALVAGNDEILKNAELLMLVVDNPDALTAISNDPEALAAYKNIVGRYKEMKVCMIAFVENANIPYSASEIMKNIRDQRNFIYFDDI